ncbi:MAG: ADP-heptose:LPS heptosyltransferase [Maribacter sp.]|jgi:ADP-heptose:LPS heptosyltransferase
MKMKVLVIRFSSIGDIVLTTPVVRCLKEQLDCEIHYMTKDAYKNLLLPNPYIYKVWTFKEKLSEVLGELSLEKFDYIIDLHKNIRSAQVKAKLKTKSFSFNKINVEKWLMVNFKINRLPQEHIVERYLATTAPLGIKNDEKGLNFFITPHQKEEAEKFILQEKIQQPFISIVIGAQYNTKIPTNDYYINICKNSPYPVILIGGPNERDKGQQITQEANKETYSSAGLLSIGGSARILERSKWVITPDTGMMHIASALNKNIISIWGNTIPSFGMKPYISRNSKNKSIIIENKSLTCRPCSKIGYNECPKKHFKCMNDLDHNRVVQLLKQGKFDINS